MRLGHSLPSLQMLGLCASHLLKLNPRTYDELADKLCVCRRYAEQVVQHLRASGFIIYSRTEQRRKFFWTTAEIDFLPTILTEEERKEVEVLFTGQNSHLQTAFHKLTQLVRG
jgi:biotin operon repressor